MAGNINGFDYLKKALEKLHVSPEEINKLDKSMLQSIFNNADFNGDGTVESKEFFKALAENFNVTNITEAQFEDPDKLLEGEFAEAFNAVKDFAKLDGNESDVSANDISKASEGVDAAAPASSPDASPTADASSGTGPATGVDYNKDNVSPVTLNGNETMEELRSGRNDVLSELTAAEQQKWNNEELKTAETKLDEANEAYAEAVENMESEDEEVQEKINEIQSEKSENDEAITNQKSTISQLHSDISAKQSAEPKQSDFKKTITKDDGTTEEVDDVDAYNAAHSRWEEEMQALQDKLQEAEEKLQELETKRDEIDAKLQKLLEEQGDKIKNKQEVEQAKQEYDNAKNNLIQAREAVAQLDTNINQLRQNLSTYDNAINKKRAEELKSAKKDDENNPWKKTDFSSYPPETIAKIAEEYGEDFYEDAGKNLSADKEEEVKQYEAITGALVSQAGSNEQIMKMLTNKMGKAAEEGDTRTLDALMKAGRKNAAELQTVIDKYNSLNDTSFSDVIRNSEKLNENLKNTYSEALKQVEENSRPVNENGLTEKGQEYLDKINDIKVPEGKNPNDKEVIAEYRAVIDEALKSDDLTHEDKLILLEKLNQASADTIKAMNEDGSLGEAYTQLMSDIQYAGSAEDIIKLDERLQKLAGEGGVKFDYSNKEALNKMIDTAFNILDKITPENAAKLGKIFDVANILSHITDENLLKETIARTLNVMYGSEDDVNALQPKIDENKNTWESKFGEAGKADTFNKVLQGIKDGNFDSLEAAKAALLWASGGDLDKMNEYIKNDIQAVQNGTKLMGELLGSEENIANALKQAGVPDEIIEKVKSAGMDSDKIIDILKNSGMDKDKQTEVIEKVLNQIYGANDGENPKIPEEYDNNKAKWDENYLKADDPIGKIAQDYANGTITAEEAKYAMLYVAGGSVKTLSEMISGKIETVKQIEQTVMAGLRGMLPSEAAARDEHEEAAKKPEKVPTGWQTDENGYIVSDDRGIRLKASSKEEVDKLHPDNKIENSKILDKDGKPIGRIDGEGNYYLYDIPEGWSIDADKGVLKDDNGKALRLVTNGKDYTVNDDNKIIKDGKEIGRVVDNGDGTKSYYIYLKDDKRIPETWQHLEDDRFFDEYGLELKETNEAGINAIDPNATFDAKTSLITDSKGNIIGRGFYYKNDKGEEELVLFEYLTPIEGKKPDDTSGPDDTTGPTGPSGPSGPSGGGDTTTPSVTPSTEPPTTPSTEPVDHQGIWDKVPEEGTKAHDIMKEILDILKSGDKKAALEKLRQMLANPDLTLDERIQILNAIAKQEPELFKELAKEEDNGLNDDFSSMLAEMTKEDSNYTIDDILKFEEIFTTSTGQTDSKLVFSTEAAEGETSAQEKFLAAVAAMYEKATPEEIKKLNDSKNFNLENNLSELLKYKDKDGNTLFSGILDLYGKNADAKKYITDHPDFAEKLSSKYIKDGVFDYETFFNDMLGSEDLDTTEERKAAIYFMTTKADFEKYLTERLEAGENDSYKLRVLLKVLGGESPGWG